MKKKNEMTTAELLLYEKLKASLINRPLAGPYNDILTNLRVLEDALDKNKDESHDRNEKDD